LAKVAELAFAERVDSSKSSQIRSVEEIMAFADRESLTEALESIHMYEDLVTEEEGTYSFLSEEVAKAVSSGTLISMPARVFNTIKLTSFRIFT
jgi:hypothetical protein